MLVILFHTLAPRPLRFTHGHATHTTTVIRKASADTLARRPLQKHQWIISLRMPAWPGSPYVRKSDDLTACNSGGVHLEHGRSTKSDCSMHRGGDLLLSSWGPYIKGLWWTAHYWSQRLNFCAPRGHMAWSYVSKRVNTSGDEYA